MNGLNITLDLWFVLGMGWGVAGVASATMLAEWSGCLLGLWLCRGAFVSAAWRDWAQVLNRARLRVMLVLNADILLRSLLLEAIFVSFLFLGSGLGDVALAANQVLLQFLMITAYALDGFAFAAEALVGRAFGAGDRQALRRGAVLTSAWGLGIVALLSLVFALFGPAIIDLMATAPEVRSEARQYLVYMVLAPVFGIAAWMFDGIFIGATRTRDMRNMMALSFVAYLAALALLVPALANHGLWLAVLISFLARGITLALRYRALESACAVHPAQSAR